MISNSREEVRQKSYFSVKQQMQRGSNSGLAVWSFTCKSRRTTGVTIEIKWHFLRALALRQILFSFSGDFFPLTLFFFFSEKKKGFFLWGMLIVSLFRIHRRAMSEDFWGLRMGIRAYPRTQLPLTWR